LGMVVGENRNRHWKKTLLINLTTDEVLFQREDELEECRSYFKERMN
jgi:hypothetical protein